MKKLLSLLLLAALLLSCAACAAAETQPLSEETAAWWNGCWYGWRVVTAAGGALADKKGLCYDVVGTIQTMDEHGVLVFWDYDSFAECCFVQANGSFHADESGLGRFLSEGGLGFDAPLGEKTLSAKPVWEFEHMLRVQGVYTDPDNAKNWFRYELFLRPWGMEWEDARERTSEELPYPSMLPLHYDDWYLDQLAKGLDPLTEEEDLPG